MFVALVRVHPARDEVGKVDTIRREHPNGAVLRVGQLDRQVDDALQQRRQREFCCQREARFEQTFGAAAAHCHPAAIIVPAAFRSTRQRRGA